MWRRLNTWLDEHRVATTLLVIVVMIGAGEVTSYLLGDGTPLIAPLIVVPVMGIGRWRLYRRKPQSGS